MRKPDIGRTIVPDVFIGRPEGLAIIVQHRRAVIAYPEIVRKKATAWSRDCGGERAHFVDGTNPH